MMRTTDQAACPPPRPGELDEPFQTLAVERSRANSAAFEDAGLKLSRRTDLLPFLRALAAHPKRIDALGPHDAFDHMRLYTRDGQPYAAVFHPYRRLYGKTLRALMEWASDAGLEVGIDADSEYYPGVTLRVALYRIGTEFPVADVTGPFRGSVYPVSTDDDEGETQARTVLHQTLGKAAQRKQQ